MPTRSRLPAAGPKLVATPPAPLMISPEQAIRRFTEIRVPTDRGFTLCTKKPECDGFATTPSPR